MTQKQLEKKVKELSEKIERLEGELRCARCTKTRPCDGPYAVPYVYPYQPYQPYTPYWYSGWTATGLASDTFEIDQNTIPASTTWTLTGDAR